METVETVLEKEVMHQVKEIINTTGIKLQRINTGNFKGKYKTAEAGTLDFEGYDKHGRFIGVECKRPCGGRVSPQQKARIDDINQAGGLAFVVTCGEDFLSILKENDCI